MNSISTLNKNARVEFYVEEWSTNRIYVEMQRNGLGTYSVA